MAGRWPLSSADEVERATERLAPRNTRQETTIRNGTLIGTVPARRFFEFHEQGADQTIEGRIGLEAQNPYDLAALYTNTLVRARIRRVQVGQGQPKYTLLEILGPLNPGRSL